MYLMEDILLCLVCSERSSEDISAFSSLVDVGTEMSLRVRPVTTCVIDV